MIKKIKIESFQSHKDTEISPSPGVNVVVGKNMSGKSALLRALRLLLYNKPDGSDFVSWGDTNTEITIEYGDHIIRRVKGKRKNVYVVDDSEFTRFGRAIPQEVIDVLGVAPIRVDDVTYELNISDPHAPPFLVSETDAVKGKVFSRLGERLLGDLVRLDKAITRANTTLRKMNSESSVLADEVVTVESALDVFLPLEGVEKKLSMCHNLLARATDMEDNLTQLRSCNETLKQVEADIEFSNDIIAIYDFVDLDSKMSEAPALQRELEVLIKCREDLISIETATDSLKARRAVLDVIPEVAQAEKELEELEVLIKCREDLISIETATDSLKARRDALAVIPEVVQAEKALEELESLRTCSLDLQRVDRAISKAKSSRKRVDSQLDTALCEYQEKLLEAKRCPICFGPVDEHSVERILEELTRDGKS